MAASHHVPAIASNGGMSAPPTARIRVMAKSHAYPFVPPGCTPPAVAVPCTTPSASSVAVTSSASFVGDDRARWMVTASPASVAGPVSAGASAAAPAIDGVVDAVPLSMCTIRWAMPMQGDAESATWAIQSPSSVAAGVGDAGEVALFVGDVPPPLAHAVRITAHTTTARPPRDRPMAHRVRPWHDGVNQDIGRGRRRCSL